MSCATMLPPSTSAVVRGSAVSGVRWKDGAPFDADGPGTSDIDLTLVGPDLLALYSLDGFFVPGCTANRSATTIPTSHRRWCRCANG